MAATTPPVAPCGAPEVVARAPGRVNLLGEHTDYTGGLVLPLAVDRWTTVRARWGSDGLIRIASAQTDDPVTTPASEPPLPGGRHWTGYVLGVLAEMWTHADFSPGLSIAVDGGVPIGAGLSSSAALAVACARALDQLTGAGLSPLDLARLCQRAEQRFAGVDCGLMDQAAAALSTPGHALLFDCRRLRWKAVPLGKAAILVVHTGIRHALASSGYNRRVAECREVAARLGEDVVLGQLLPAAAAKLARALPEPLARRLLHVVAENERVRRGVACLEAGDLEGFGRLMLASHASLRDLFEVSCPELDAIVDELSDVAHGAKLTGAGFGGAVVALVPPARLAEALRRVERWPLVLDCRPFDG